MSLDQNIPGSDMIFDKPGIPSPAWNDEISNVSSEVQGNFVLIEAITTDSDQYSLSYTVEPEGDPYEFKAIGVIVNVKKASVISDIVITSLYNKDVVQSGIIKEGISSESDKYGFVKMYQTHGIWETQGCLAVNGYTQQIEQVTCSSMMYTFNTKDSEYPYIDEIHIAPKVNGTKIPSGSYIQIFAVRK